MEPNASSSLISSPTGTASSVATDSTLVLEEVVCGFTEECEFGRFLVITALSLVACVGACCNGLLAWIFIRYSFPNTPPTLYPTFLAILDALICCFYMLLFGVDVWMVYLRIESLFVIYHTYIVPAFVLSKITQLAIPYLLIFATMERYAWISENLRNFCLFSTAGRPISVICCLVICIMLRSPALWALTVEQFPQCPDFFRSLAVAPAEWVLRSELYAIYDFWIMAFIQTFLPFIVLVAINIIIVKRLSAVHCIDFNGTSVKQATLTALTADTTPSASRRSSHKLSLISRKRMPEAVRSAVYTTLAIVASYLVCNTLHMVLTVLERSKSSLLDDEEDATKASTFYTLFGDTVSALYMVSSASRIVIYCKCNPVIKQHIEVFFARLCPWSQKSRNKAMQVPCFAAIPIKDSLSAISSEAVCV